MTTENRGPTVLPRLLSVPGLLGVAATCCQTLDTGGKNGSSSEVLAPLGTSFLRVASRRYAHKKTGDRSSIPSPTAL